MEAWLEPLGQTPNYAAAKAPGLTGKAVAYRRVRNKLDEPTIEEAKYVELLTMPAGDENFLEPPVSASISGSRHDAFVAVDTEIHKVCQNEWVALASRIHAAIPFVYGYQYVLPYSVGPGFYAHGTVYGGFASRSHEEELRTRWSHVRLSPEKNPRDQRIRQVYALQFLSDAHLRLPVGAITLREWIEATPRRGWLRALLPGCWTWSVPEPSAIDTANRELFAAGLLSAWDPNLAQPM